jgi:hypothetical protein
LTQVAVILPDSVIGTVLANGTSARYPVYLTERIGQYEQFQEVA